jgi:hypothetical protein
MKKKILLLFKIYIRLLRGLLIRLKSLMQRLYMRFIILKKIYPHRLVFIAGLDFSSKNLWSIIYLIARSFLSEINNINIHRFNPTFEPISYWSTDDLWESIIKW